MIGNRACQINADHPCFTIRTRLLNTCRRTVNEEGTAALKAKPDCIPCLFNQALNTTRVASDDPALHIKALRELARVVPRLRFNQTPAALSQPLYALVARVTGVRDPYALIKRQTNKAALQLVNDLGALVRQSADPLKAAVHLAAAGNIIDLGIGHKFDLEKDVTRIMGQRFAIDDYAAFKRELRPGRRLLYLGDNAGEIVFDRVLVEHLLQAEMNVTFVVKSGPIINDATMADAEFCGLTRLCPVIETGSNDIGVHWRHVSAEFRRHVRHADILLGKGHGNFETCSGRAGNYYFLLKAKCAMVAQELGVALGDTVFKHAPGAHPWNGIAISSAACCW
jgi:damage-control phosphatase, subfamily I